VGCVLGCSAVSDSPRVQSQGHPSGVCAGLLMVVQSHALFEAHLARCMLRTCACARAMPGHGWLGCHKRAWMVAWLARVVQCLYKGHMVLGCAQGGSAGGRLRAALNFSLYAQACMSWAPLVPSALRNAAVTVN
jgi:hypothetical protein